MLRIRKYNSLMKRVKAIHLIEHHGNIFLNHHEDLVFQQPNMLAEGMKN